jgi:hypothetical protein
MKKRIIHLPKQGIPAWHPPKRKDTRIHLWMRRVLIAGTFAGYAVVLFMFLLGFAPQLHVFHVLFLSFVPLVAVVAADVLVRPGRRVWLGWMVLTLGCVSHPIGMLALWILPLVLLWIGICKALQGKSG